MVPANFLLDTGVLQIMININHLNREKVGHKIGLPTVASCRNQYANRVKQSHFDIHNNLRLVRPSLIWHQTELRSRPCQR